MAIRWKALPLAAAAAWSVAVSAAGHQPALEGSVLADGRETSLSPVVQTPPSPEGRFPELSTGVGAPDWDAVGSGGSTREADQPINCEGGARFSNANSNIIPYLVFDDFVADETPLEAVQFFGGVSGGTLGFDAISEIGLEIWTIASGGECGWTYDQPVYLDVFTMPELDPTFECSMGNALADAYEFTANLHGVPPLVPGQSYLITIYARLRNPDGPELFVWAHSSVTRGRAAHSWNRMTQQHRECGPDMAFRTLPIDSCQENSTATGSYFSNYFSSHIPYLSFDDFVARSTGDLRTIRVTGGVSVLNQSGGTDFSNIAGLMVEVHHIRGDNSTPCRNWFNGLVGQFTVPLEDTMPRYDATDPFGISFYTFTIPVPPGVTLVEGERYLLGVFGDQVDRDSPELFCWAGTGSVHGYKAWSFDLRDGSQHCHDVDQAFCIDPEESCPGDFNLDGAVDTRDVIAFLNAWSDRDLAADMDYNLVIDSRDVLGFLNIWNTDCLP